MKNINKELIELLLENPLISYNQEKHNFYNKFNILLQETPSIHIDIKRKPEFFTHFFLGSVLNLPDTVLAKNLNIKAIYYNISQDKKTLKLAFVIQKDSNIASLKLFTISTATFTQGFVQGDIQKIQNLIANNRDLNNLKLTEFEAFKLSIINSGGFKCTSETQQILVMPSDSDFHHVISRSNLDYDSCIPKLASTEVGVVQLQVKRLMSELVKTYYAYSELGLGTSEASYHGYLYGFFRLNYSYYYQFDCYVERTAGKGYIDLILLSRFQNNNPFPIIFELKSGSGAAVAIQQIHQKGYVYHLPNVRTSNYKAVIVGLDFKIQDEHVDQKVLQVQIVDIYQNDVGLLEILATKAQQFFSDQASQDFTALQNICKEHLKHLYYASIKSKDATYLSMLLLGQFSALSLSYVVQKYVFDYSFICVGGSITTLILKLNDKRGIVLNILEMQSKNADMRLQSSDISTRNILKTDIKLDLSNKMVPNVIKEDIDQLLVINFKVNPTAQDFSGARNNYLVDDQAVRIFNKNDISSLHSSELYEGEIIRINNIAVNQLSEAMLHIDDKIRGYHSDSSMRSDDYGPSTSKRRKVFEPAGVIRDKLSECLSPLKKFIARESDVQAIIQGLFINYKHNKYTVNVISEATCGHGRIDLELLFNNQKGEQRAVIIEVKYNEVSLEKAESQILEYVKYLKSSTNIVVTQCIALSYIADKPLLVSKFTAKVPHTSQSSGEVSNQVFHLRKISNTSKKQIGLVNYIIKTIFHNNELDLSKLSYNLSSDDYVELFNFLHNIPVLKLNLSRHNIADTKVIDALSTLIQVKKIKKLSLVDASLREDGMSKLLNALQENPEGIIELDLLNHDLKSHDVSALVQLFSKSPDLEYIALSGVKTGMRDILKTMEERNKKIKTLVITNSIFDCECHVPFENVMQNNEISLKTLVLSDNVYDERNMVWLLNGAAYATNIEEFTLVSNAQVLPDTALYAVDMIISSLVKLKKLTLKSCNIQNHLKSLSINLLNLNNLLDLDLSDNKISNFDLVFNFIKMRNTVTHLNLSNNIKNEVESWELFAKILTLKSIVSVKLRRDSSDSDFTTQSELNIIRILNNLKINCKLKHFDLSGHYITQGIAVNLFRGLTITDTLNSIALSNCKMRDYTAHEIFVLLNDLFNNQVNWIEEIDLSNNMLYLAASEDIKAEHHISVAQFIKENCALKKLNLADNNIADEGVKMLINALRNKNKDNQNKNLDTLLYNVDLDLSGNTAIDDDGVLHIIDALDYLQNVAIKLQGITFGKAAIKKLAKKLFESAKFGQKRVADIQLSANSIVDKPVVHAEIDETTEEIVDVYHIIKQIMISELKYHKNQYMIQNHDDLLFDFPALQCLNDASRPKRAAITECAISWHDVDEISRNSVRNEEEIVIDAEKFFKYSKLHIDNTEKSKQLISLVHEIKGIDPKRIEGDHQNMLDQVIKVGGYKQYIEYEKLNYLVSQAFKKQNTPPELKMKLLNTMGRIQLAYGLYGTQQLCGQAQEQDTNAKTDLKVDCALNVAEISYESLSRPATHILQKNIARSNIHKIFGTHLAKGAASTIAHSTVQSGAIVFDIIDIIRSAIALHECSKNQCSEKESRDHIASITFAGISGVSSVTFIAAGVSAPIAITVGLVVFGGRLIYNAASNLVEYQKYNITFSEKLSILWNSIALKEIDPNIAQIQLRSESINALVKSAYDILLTYPDDVIAISLGLGEEYWHPTIKCSVNFFEYQELTEVEYANLSPRAQDLCSITQKWHLDTGCSRIDLSNKLNKAITLSRILPKDIANTTMICLPKKTNQEYEKGLGQFRSEAVYQCDNAVVILHNQRAAMQLTDAHSQKSIIHDLSYINSGKVSGSLEWNNYFIIGRGNASIFGTNVSYNIFQLHTKDYSGKIFLDTNSTNVLDLSHLQVSNVRVLYTHVISRYLNVSVTIDGTISSLYALHPNTKIYYAGSDKVSDKITCNVKQHYRSSPDFEINDTVTMVVDSGGAQDDINIQHDIINNCHIVLMSPNTVVLGNSKGCVVYVKQPIYTVGTFSSSISNPNGANVIFMMPFFINCKSVSYHGEHNSLSITFLLPGGDKNAEYTVSLIQYAHSDNTTDYMLTDQNGMRIVPLIQHTAENTNLKHFLVYKEIAQDYNLKNAVSYYKNISYTGEDYIISVQLIYKQGLCIFGSIEHDLLIETKDVLCISGGKGRDIYEIDDKKKKELYIHNYSDDLALDFLVIQPLQSYTIDTRASDVVLHFASRDIILDHYLVNVKNQHIAIIDHEYRAAIPFYKRHYGDIQISTLPFYYASPTQNVYVLSDHVVSGVINIASEDIAIYRQKSDLLITDQREPFGILNIILKDYYDMQGKRKQVKLYSYDNGAVGGVINLSKVQLRSKKVSHIYDNIMHEYIVDLSKEAKKIEHNNEFVGLGIILFQNTLLDSLSVMSDQNDLILISSVYNTSLILKSWYNKQYHHAVSVFEFDNTLFPSKRIWLSDGFEKRINFNYQISNKILDMGRDLYIAALDYLISDCKKKNSHDLMNSTLRYSFLEYEISNYKHLDIMGKMQLLSNNDDNFNRVFMLLLVKHYNQLLLEYPNIETVSLYSIDDSCLTSRIVSKSAVDDIVQYLNSSAEYGDKVFEIYKHNEKSVTNSLTHNADHKHRHHHGEHIVNHHRYARNIEENAEDYVLPYNADYTDVDQFLVAI